MLLRLVHYHVIVQLVFLTLFGIVNNKFPIQKNVKKMKIINNSKCNSSNSFNNLQIQNHTKLIKYMYTVHTHT